MTCIPDHQTQLGRGSRVPGRTMGSRDCGPRTVQMGIDAVTCGVFVPPITSIRKRMDKPGGVPTSIDDAKRAVESYKGLRYFRKDTVEGVQAVVKAGKFVQLAIDYGVFNDLMRATGDPAYRGGHSVGVMGERKRGGTVQWLLFDPLDDDRRDGIPWGPRWVPRRKLIKALESFAGGEGRAQAGAFGGKKS